jgi:hypothetical protein
MAIEMSQNPFQELADQLGFMTYLFVMGAGRPDLQLMTLRAPAELARPRSGDDLRGLLDSSVPLEVGREHEDAAA